MDITAQNALDLCAVILIFSLELLRFFEAISP